jgi:hypothetical protein
MYLADGGGAPVEHADGTGDVVGASLGALTKAPDSASDRPATPGEEGSEGAGRGTVEPTVQLVVREADPGEATAAGMSRVPPPRALRVR